MLAGYSIDSTARKKLISVLYCSTPYLGILILSLCVVGDEGGHQFCTALHQQKNTSISLREGWVGSGAGLNCLVNRKICLHLPGFEPRIFQPLALSHNRLSSPGSLTTNVGRRNLKSNSNCDIKTTFKYKLLSKSQ